MGTKTGLRGRRISFDNIPKGMSVKRFEIGKTYYEPPSIYNEGILRSFTIKNREANEVFIEIENSLIPFKVYIVDEVEQIYLDDYSTLRADFGLKEKKAHDRRLREKGKRECFKVTDFEHELITMLKRAEVYQVEKYLDKAYLSFEHEGCLCKFSFENTHRFTFSVRCDIFKGDARIKASRRIINTRGLEVRNYEINDKFYKYALFHYDLVQYIIKELQELDKQLEQLNDAF